MTTAYIGIGSNIPESFSGRLKHCKVAIKELSTHPNICILQVSSWRETKPVGVKDQTWFINGATKIETSLKPHDLLKVLKSIEKKIGRVKTYRWGPRIIDLDLLLYGSEAFKSAKLTLPHPRIIERDFVKVPLLEIDPTLEHFFHKPSNR